MPFPPKMTPAQKIECLHFWCYGVRQAQLAKRYGVSTATICMVIKKLQARPA